MGIIVRNMNMANFSHVRLGSSNIKNFVMLDGMSAWYKLDGDILDHHGDNNNSTVYPVGSSPYYSEGFSQMNKVLDLQNFDAIQYEFTGHNVMTLSFWVNLNNIMNTGGCFVSINRVDIGFISNMLYAVPTSTARYYNYSFTGGNRDKWTHICVRISSPSVVPSIHVNNVPVGLTGGGQGYTTSISNLSIGKRSYSIYTGFDRVFYNGRISNLKIFNRQITQEEIELLYNELA